MVDLHTRLAVVKWRWLSLGPLCGENVASWKNMWLMLIRSIQGVCVLLCFITEIEVKVHYNLELVKTEFGFVQRNLEP